MTCGGADRNVKSATLATRVDAKRGERELAREPIPRVLEGGYDSVGRGPTTGPHLTAHCRAVRARTDHAACPSHFIELGDWATG